MESSRSIGLPAHDFSYTGFTQSQVYVEVLW